MSGIFWYIESLPCSEASLIRRNIRLPERSQLKRCPPIFAATFCPTSESCVLASWGSDLIICRSPKSAGNLATSDSEISDSDSCTDRDFSVSGPGAAAAAPAPDRCDISSQIQESSLLLQESCSHLASNYAKTANLSARSGARCNPVCIWSVILAPARSQLGSGACHRLNSTSSGRRGEESRPAEVESPSASTSGCLFV